MGIESTHINNESLPKAIDRIAAMAREGMRLNIEQLAIGGDRPMVALIPDGTHVEDLGKLLPARPDRKRVKAELLEPASFVEYVNEHKSGATRVFASKDGTTFLAAIDYHEPGPEGKASWITHSAELTLTRSKPWAAWTNSDRKPMEQVAFAEFIDVNSVDVVRPDSATIKEIALSLQASAESRFVSKHRLDNGNIHFEHFVDAAARAGKDGALDIPEKIGLRLAPFDGMPCAELEAYFRWRLNNGKLTLFYQLIRPERFVDAVVAEISALVRDNTGCPVYRGSFSPSK